MTDFVIDFPGYVKQRRRNESPMYQGAAPYAYAGDQKMLRTLERITPVKLAAEATVRLWRSVSRSEILGGSVKVSEKQFPEIHQLAVACARKLEIATPTVYIAPDVGSLNAHTFGTSDDAYIVLNGVLIDYLSPEELSFVIGHECGHIQNNHVVYNTSLYYLVYSAHQFVRWIVQPAVLALQSWSRRAEITCDRAGLICCGKLDYAIAALIKIGLGSTKLAEQIDVEEYLTQLEESQQDAGRYAELTHSHPYLPKRVKALQLFADTHYYLHSEGSSVATDGKSLKWCDDEVAKLIAVVGKGKANDKPEDKAADPPDTTEPANETPAEATPVDDADASDQNGEGEAQ